MDGALSDVPYEWIRIRAIPGTEHVQLRCARCAAVKNIATVSTPMDLGREASDFVVRHRGCRKPTVH